MEESCFIRVDDWEPDDNDSIITHDGKLLIVPFDKIFNRDKIKGLNTFIIKKESYVKRLGTAIFGKDTEPTKGICHYLNYFIKYYDTNNELLLAYLKMKYVIDDKNHPIKRKAFINMMYTIIFTDTIKEKIVKMVEDNYYIEVTNDEKRKYAEALKFTEEHAKLMMMISIAMKIMVPVMFHYINTYNLLKDEGIIFKFYEDLFTMFNDEIDIYNKLYTSIKAKINKSFSHNKKMWNQKEIYGMDPLIYQDELLKDKIITETMFKYSFNKNIINLNSVVLDKQLGYFNTIRYDKNLIELSSKKDPEGLSGLTIGSL